MQSTTSKFTFLIANYNNGKLFNDCYKSIIAQTVSDWEVIILDDCSTDNSLEIINNIIGNDARFTIEKNQKNRGVGFTKRKLIELSNSEICGFLDPDDAVETNALQLLLKAHQDNQEVGLVYSNFTFCDENLNKKSLHTAKQITSLDDSYYNFHGEISHFVTFKKAIYLQTTGIDPFLKIAEDKDWYMKMCEIAPVLHLNESLYLYRIHGGGISTNENAEKALFWHWVAMMKMAERTGTSIENLFLKQYANRNLLDKQIEINNLNTKFRKRLKNSKWLKLGKFLGLFKNYDEL
jgi:glycosyltransferase involved in cell wall biosynthesis